MNDDRNATMADALRLTRDGRLMEATALLQQSLGGAGHPAPAQPAPAGGGMLDKLQARPARKLSVGLPGNSPLVRPGLTRSGGSAAAAAAASAPGGDIRHLTHVDAAGVADVRPLHSYWLCRRAGAARRHAARWHPGRHGLCGRHPDE